MADLSTTTLIGRPGPGRFTLTGTGIESPIGNDMLKRNASPLSQMISVHLGDGCGDRNEVPVTQHSVLSVAPMWRATNILCGLIGRIRIELKRRGARNKSTVQVGDNRHFLISRKPHYRLKARTWKKAMMLHAQIGPSGGFSEIIRDPETREPMAVMPLDPNRMGWGVILDAQNQPRQMVYMYVDDPRTMEARPIDPDNVLHFKGLSYDAIMGIDTVNLLQREFGLILARQNYMRKYYLGNARIRGFLMVPAGMDLTLYSNMMEVIRQHLDAQDADPTKTVPLFDGVKYQATQDSPENSQLTEAMQMTPDTVGVITGVPSFLLGADTRDSYRSLEKVMQGFLFTTVDDWFHEFESEIDDKMLSEEELRSDELGFKFDRRQLMATDIGSFHQMLREDLHSGLSAWEEVREQMDATTDAQGLTFFVPQNIVGANPTELGTMGRGDNADGGGTGVPAQNRSAMRNLVHSTATRVCNRLSRAAVNKAPHVDRFEEFLATLQPGGREHAIELENLSPVYDVAIDAGLIDAPPAMCIVDRFRQSLNAAIDQNHVRPFPDVIADLCRQLTHDTAAELAGDILGLSADAPSDDLPAPAGPPSPTL